LKDLLIVRFTFDNIKDIWYVNYLNCKQEIIELVEEYSNYFKRLYQKIDFNAGILIINTIC